MDTFARYLARQYIANKEYSQQVVPEAAPLVAAADIVLIAIVLDRHGRVVTFNAAACTIAPALARGAPSLASQYASRLCTKSAGRSSGTCLTSGFRSDALCAFAIVTV